MAFFNQLLTFLGNVAVYGGGILAAVGIIRWISGGKSHDAQEQQGAVWMIALGGATAAIGGAIASGILQFPTL